MVKFILKYNKMLFVLAISVFLSLNAKNAKIDRKLKMIDLQLKKARIDQQQSKIDGSTETIDTGDAVVLDRNSLLEKLLKNDK